MARLFYTGFETGSREWNGAASNAPNAPTITSSVRRTGTYSCQLNATATAAAYGYFRHVFDDNETELFGRFALRIDQGNFRNVTLLEFCDSSNGTQALIRYDFGTQTLEWRDGGGTILAVGNVLVPDATWIVVEFRVLIDGAAGQLLLKINGTTDATWSGDTDYTNLGNVRSVYFRAQPTASATGSTTNCYFDDIAINNADDSYQNSWIGLGGVFYLEPTADGAQNDWTPSAGTANYAMVDDIPPDNATTFNQALDSGSIDLYEVDDCPEYIASIHCLQVSYRAALVTSGYNELTDLVRVGTVNYSGTEHTIVPITPSFTYYLGTIHYLNPSSGSAWGTVDVNAMQAGMEITT